MGRWQGQHKHPCARTGAHMRLLHGSLLHAQVYQAVFAMYSRDLKHAASLFHEAIATFSA